MVFKNKSKHTGTGLKNSIIKNMLEASYKDLREAPEIILTNRSPYILDKQLSTDEVKVYDNSLKSQAVVVVRGTDITKKRDIFTDISIPFSFLETSRYKEAKQILDKVIDYYHDNLGYKVDVIGHSLGGKIAYEISRELPEDPTVTTLRPEIHELITVNSAGSFEDKLTTNPPNKWDIKTPDFLKRFGLTTPQPYIDPVTGISHTIEIDDKESKPLFETFSGF